MNNQLIFYTQIGSILLYLVSLFVLYRLLVEQKEATIQLLKEKADWLQKQLDIAKQESPDVILKKLEDRIHIYSNEIARLSKDKESNEALIKEKSENLEQTETMMKVTRDYVSNLNGYIEILRWQIKDKEAPSETITVTEPIWFEGMEGENRQPFNPHKAK
jgi:hypothetical protein